nr:MAG TPA: hypothetical protein [Caudoviricetes sp.]
MWESSWSDDAVFTLSKTINSVLCVLARSRFRPP